VNEPDMEKVMKSEMLRSTGKIGQKRNVSGPFDYGGLGNDSRGGTAMYDNQWDIAV
jgi:hypothetical protein